MCRRSSGSRWTPRIHMSYLVIARKWRPQQFEDVVDIAFSECERFFPAFQFVLWGGKSPEEALAAAMLETVGEA